MTDTTPAGRASICVVYTGGTMGSKNDPATGQLGPASLNDFSAEVRRLAAAGDWGADLTVIAVPGRLIDSADANPTDWLRIRNALEAGWNHFDGFVVVHGTDTMPYTAAFLSFAIERQDRPVVVTGSMKPIFIAGDAAPNLEASVRIAASRNRDGSRIDQVLIAFGGRILRGNRATKISLEDEAFSTPRVSDVGKFTVSPGGRMTIVWSNGGPTSQVQAEGDGPHFKRVSDQNLVLIRLHPGVSPSTVDRMLEDADGAVVEAYGTGTGPVAIRECLESRAASGLPIVVTTEVLDGEVTSGYETDLVRANSPLISGGTMLAETALAKLYYFLGIYTGKARTRWIRERMLESNRGDN
jgi:L-asparaginase